MKIKTVFRRVDNYQEFDQDVNQAIEEGWVLTKREVLPGGPVSDSRWMNRLLYAELVLPDPPAEPVEPDLFACAEIIRLECAKYESCTECPLENVCTCTAPHAWRPPHD